jgi:protein-S-isoprenylcysteine O-methyltransferase Ste14
VSASGWYRALVLLELVIAVPTFVALLRVTAPYGRHKRGGWGPTVPARVGWLVMESPAAVLFAAVFAAGAHRAEPVPLTLLALWEAHYVYRAFVYPVLLRPGARMPLAVVMLAIGFNTLNAWINARWVSTLGHYRLTWFTDPRFLAGVVLFGSGLALHVTSDRSLRRLRAAGETGYRVPGGGVFEWVSCPNYLGEIVEWIGWALATWSLAGLAFALYTIANLVPRALSHHAWYRDYFPNYPPRRRALIPWVV